MMNLLPRSTTTRGLLLALAAAACLAPFLNKAAHIDDPLFLWTAQQIQRHPLDFYGFEKNWFNRIRPMPEVMKNPPLASYYLAGIGLLGGVDGLENMPWLHAWFLLPAAAAIAGTYRLAMRFGNRPALAALVTLLAPGFLVSSTNLMCDTMLLCFWVWALVFWDQGLEADRLTWLFVAGILMALAAMTKYFGMSLLPLAVTYALLVKRRPGRWLIALVIPLAVLAGYQWATHQLYGRGLLLDAATYTQEARSVMGAEAVSKILVSLAFLGGCAASAVCYFPFLWSKRALIRGLVLAAVIPYGLYVLGRLGSFKLVESGQVRWEIILQAGFWCTAGVGLLALVGADLRRSRDARSWLLALWIAGTLVFAVFINWTINGRTLLPLIPALGILVMRRLEERFPATEGTISWRLAAPLVPAAALAFALTGADYRLANAAHGAADEITMRFGKAPGTLWFQGHWGFQYYMEADGAQPFDMKASQCRPGDYLVIPPVNDVIGVPTSAGPIIAEIGTPLCPGLTTMTLRTAGFYSDVFGPLPFAFGQVPPATYQVIRFTPQAAPEDARDASPHRGQ